MTVINSQTVTNAKLCLYNVDGASAGGDFHNVNDDTWQEETVTWNNAPAADTTLLAELGQVSANTWYEVNLTTLITGDGTYSLRISDSVGGADYSSKEGANAPKLLVALGGATPQSCSTTATATPTNTPTPGPSPTPTNTSAPTATQPPQGAFNSATFVYDGDGKRVKSTFNGATTTYFVGNHYEVTGSTITKYYYAGAQRIAMRTNGTLNYLLGDHLGSTSLVTDSSGVKINEQRYKAWGETRYTFGTEKTKYQYTGQYSYASDFGLHYYNARWYDSSLGRFTQADTIIPQHQGVQAWDRYAYTNNNPVRYTDPSGHCIVIICLAAAGVMLAAEFSLSAVGVVPDGIGIITAKAISIGRETDATVLAGIAVQSQYPWAIVGGDARGWAQVKSLDNPYSPSVALHAMEKQIDGAIEACGTDCTSGTDRFIVAAIAQNGGFSLEDFKHLPMSGGAIDWDSVMLERGSNTTDTFASIRQNLTNQNYNTQFMLRLFTNDVQALLKLGYDLSEDYADVDWEEINRLINLRNQDE